MHFIWHIITSGNPEPRITWYKDGKIFRKSGYRESIKKNFLKISDSNPYDSGIYTCEARSDDESLSPLRYSVRLIVEGM